MIKNTVIILLVSTLFSCSMLTKLATEGAKVNDEALKTSEFTICRAASIGSIMRRYNTKELAKAWKDLCTNESKNIPVMLEEITDSDIVSK